MTKIQDDEVPMRSMYDLLIEMNEARGFRRGEQQGMQQGMQRILVGQLEARFGELPADVLARLEAADVATLQRWCVRVITAERITDVLVD